MMKHWREVYLIALRPVIDIFIPIVLGLFFVKTDIHIDNLDDAGNIVLFFMWIALALWVQRQPAALVEACKTEIKESGLARGHLFMTLFPILVVYILPLSV